MRWVCETCGKNTYVTRGRGSVGGWVTGCCGSRAYRRRSGNYAERYLENVPAEEKAVKDLEAKHVQSVTPDAGETWLTRLSVKQEGWWDIYRRVGDLPEEVYTVKFHYMADELRDLLTAQAATIAALTAELAEAQRFYELATSLQVGAQEQAEEAREIINTLKDRVTALEAERDHINGLATSYFTNWQNALTRVSALEVKAGLLDEAKRYVDSCRWHGTASEKAGAENLADRIRALEQATPPEEAT